MSWSQSLDVAGGEIEFQPSTHAGILTAPGLLEYAQAFKVRFQDASYHAPQAIPEIGSGNAEKLRIAHDVVGFEQRIHLGPTKRPSGSQPKSFLDLCTRLLDPRPREDYGYIFSADLRLDGRDPIRIEFDEQEWVHGSFVQFARFQEPYAFVAWGNPYTCEKPRLHGLTCAQEFRVKLILELGWPPDELSDVCGHRWTDRRCGTAAPARGKHKTPLEGSGCTERATAGASDWVTGGGEGGRGQVADGIER